MTPYYADDHLTLYGGDCREVMASMPERSVHTVVTSPPYWGLRDYGTDGQLGLEPTPEAYVANMVAVFREVRRVLRDDGTLWLNLGDSYASSPPGRGPQPGVSGLAGINSATYQATLAAGHSTHAGTLDGARAIGLKAKDLIGIPWRVAFALQADGWYLRSDIIWSKPNPMPESVTDRPTKAHEYLFLLSKSARYHYDAEAVREASTTTRPELLEFGERQDVGLPEGRTDDRRRARYATPNGPVRSPHGQGFTRRSDKQATTTDHGIGNGHHVAGLNDRWDASERDGTAPLTRNLRSVWTIATEPYPGAHFATFPRKLVEPCVKAGCPADGTVLDPFAGSGTTLLVAQALGRKAVGIDLNPDYLAQAMHRNRQTPLGLVG